MPEPDGLVLYCSPIQYRDMRVREELRKAFDIAIATKWDGDPDDLIPFSDCLDAHRAAYGPTTEQSTNMQDEIAKLDAGLMRPKDAKYPAVSDPDSKPVADGRSLGIADLQAALQRSQEETRRVVLAALGMPVPAPPVPPDPMLDRSNWNPAFRAEVERVEREVDAQFEYAERQNRAQGLV